MGFFPRDFRSFERWLTGESSSRIFGYYSRRNRRRKAIEVRRARLSSVFNDGEENFVELGSLLRAAGNLHEPGTNRNGRAIGTRDEIAEGF